jgi:chemotaxis protein methyltransferase CheR
MKAHEESMSAPDYARLCGLIYQEAGIHLNAEKKTMLEARIRRRLKALNIPSFSEYCATLFGRHGMKDEIPHLIDVVTTNKTDFFREPKHFDFLTAKALPDLTARNRLGRPLLIWSAGCSTGEEPYTLAMVMSEYAQTHPGLRFRILATDISTTVLAKADRGVYTKDVVAPVPAAFKLKYCCAAAIAVPSRCACPPSCANWWSFAVSISWMPTTASRKKPMRSSAAM